MMQPIGSTDKSNGTCRMTCQLLRVVLEIRKATSFRCLGLDNCIDLCSNLRRMLCSTDMSVRVFITLEQLSSSRDFIISLSCKTKTVLTCTKRSDTLLSDTMSEMPQSLRMDLACWAAESNASTKSADQPAQLLTDGITTPLKASALRCIAHSIAPNLHHHTPQFPCCQQCQGPHKRWSPLDL